MKTLVNALLFWLMVAMIPNGSFAQIVVPNENPRATLTQELGLNLVSFEYTRPSTKGHVIFGERVPFGERWLNNDRLYVRSTFTNAVVLENDYTLPAGTYAFEAIPGRDQWTLIVREGQFQRQTTAFLDMEEGYYFESDSENRLFIPGKEVARFATNPMEMKEKSDNFTILLTDICQMNATVNIMWDYTRVSFQISNMADQKMLEKIEQFTNNPEAKLAGEYYLAARYYLDTNRDLDKALEWIDKSLNYAPDAFWVVHTKAEIYAKMGDYREAIKYAEESMQLARDKNDMDFVRINQQEIDRWKELRKGSE